MKKDELRPKQILREIGRIYPNAWKDVKMFRNAKGHGLPDWSDWCYLPIAAGVAITTQGINSRIYTKTADSVLNPATVTAAAAWRVSQGVYKFDADLYNVLIEQPMDDNLPCEALKRLPEYCVYIETINAKFMDEPIEGFFAHLEEDVNDKREELRFVFMMKNGVNMPLAVHLGEWTLEEGLKKMKEEANNQTHKNFDLEINLPNLNVSKEITPFLQLTIYICAENIDTPVKPQHPSTRKRMSGGIDAPKEPRLWNVGQRIGTAIRKYRNNENSRINISAGEKNEVGIHSSPRPHVRRAHWHSFWIGAKDSSDRKIIIKWLPPIPVGAEDGENPVVIHSVK